MKKKQEIDQHGHQSSKNYGFHLLTILLLSILSTSCSINKNIIDHNDVETIKFWYLSKGLHTPAAIEDCSYVVYDTISNKDTIINDRMIIAKYIEIINELKPAKKHINYDLRVASSIKLKNGKQKYIGVCVSPNGVTLIDDILMKKDMRIVKLLDEILYNHLTEKDWTFPFLLEDNEE